MKGKTMLIVMIILGVLLVIVLVVAGVIGYYNYQADKMPEHAEFAKGTVPAQMPDGPYNGSATVNIGTWRGKQFDRAAKTGINRFSDGNSYEFTTYVGKGLRDPNEEVVKIDYNQPSNPWWLRLVTDEIVQVGPNEFLGKIHISPLPGVTVTYGYFRLKK